MTEKKNHVRPCPHCGATRVECMNAFSGYYPCCSKCEHAPAVSSEARARLERLEKTLTTAMLQVKHQIDGLDDAETGNDVRARVLGILQQLYGVEQIGDDPDDALFILVDVLQQKSIRLVDLQAKLASVTRYRPSILWRSPRDAADAGDVWYCADVYAALGMDAPHGPVDGRALDQATSQNQALVTFLYLLTRDEVTTGVVERLLKETKKAERPVFSAPHVEAQARVWAKRLEGRR